MSHHKFIFILLLACNLSAQLMAESCSLDFTFNPGSGVSDEVFGLAMQTNGQILIGGNFLEVSGQFRIFLARLNSDGSLDNSYECHIMHLEHGGVSAVTITSDGKCLIGGNFLFVNDIVRQYFARLRSDGSLDTTFDNMEFNGPVRKIETFNNGDYLVYGDFSRVKGVNRNKIARLTSKGQVDPLFDPASAVSGNQILSYVMQPDGAFILSGTFTNVGSGDHRFIVRVSQDGTPDENFKTEYISGSSIRKVILQPDGKIIIFGSFYNIDGYLWGGIARLNTNGSLDKSFPRSGLSSDVEEYCYQPNGECILAGIFGLYRLNSDGSSDADFKPNAFPGVHNILIQPDGKLLVVGNFTQIASTNINRIARLNIDGSVPATPIFLNPRLFLGSHFMGDTGAKYRIEYTTNLTTPGLWTPLTNFTIQSGPVLFVDPSEISADSSRFYRAVFLP